MASGRRDMAVATSRAMSSSRRCSGESVFTGLLNLTGASSVLFSGVKLRSFEVETK